MIATIITMSKFTTDLDISIVQFCTVGYRNEPGAAIYLESRVVQRRITAYLQYVYMNAKMISYERTVYEELITHFGAILGYSVPPCHTDNLKEKCLHKNAVA